MHLTSDTLRLRADIIHLNRDTLRLRVDTVRLNRDTLRLRVDTVHLNRDTLRLKRSGRKLFFDSFYNSSLTRLLRQRMIIINE